MNELQAVREAAEDARMIGRTLAHAVLARDEAIRAAVAAGYSYSEVAMVAGVGKSSVHAIVSRSVHV